MEFNIFICAAIAGLALVLLLLVASRLEWRVTGRLCRFTCVITSLVGLALIAVAAVTYSSSGANAADAIRNSLFNAEDVLRHWFHSLSLR